MFVLGPDPIPLRPRNTRYLKRCERAQVWNLLALVPVWLAGTPGEYRGKEVALALSLSLFSAVSAVQIRLSWLALHDRHPRWAKVQIDGRWPTRRVIFKLDMDAPANTYRAYGWWRRWRRWKPTGMITWVDLNALSPGDILAFGPVTISYEQARTNFIKQMEPAR